MELSLIITNYPRLNLTHIDKMTHSWSITMLMLGQLALKPKKLTP